MTYISHYEKSKIISAEDFFKKKERKYYFRISDHLLMKIKLSKIVILLRNL